MSSFTSKNVKLNNVLINISPKSYLKNMVFESIKDKIKRNVKRYQVMISKFQKLKILIIY